MGWKVFRSEGHMKNKEGGLKEEKADKGTVF